MLAFTPLSAPTFAGLALSSLLLAGCASSPPVAKRYIPPPVGATVEYQVTNTGSFGSRSGPLTMKVSEVTWEGRTLRKYETPVGSTLHSERAGVVAALDTAGRPLMRYDPPLDYSFPLEVGKTWTGNHALTVGAGTKMPMVTSWKVEAYEDVIVPAGTFKAWRLVMTDNFGFRQTIWSVPEKMGMFAQRVQERATGHPPRRRHAGDGDDQGAGREVMRRIR